MAGEASPELVAFFRQQLQHAPDEQLAGFLSNYAVATIAEHLISLLVPESRRAFVAAIAARWPEAFFPEPPPDSANGKRIIVPGT